MCGAQLVKVDYLFRRGLSAKRVRRCEQGEQVARAVGAGSVW